MLRFPSEEALQEFLAKSNARLCRPLAGERMKATAVDQPEKKPKKVRAKPKPVKPTKPRSDLEVDMERQINERGIQTPTLELKFDPVRKWRFDFAWPEFMLALEVEGSVHRIKGRFKSDIEKYAMAQLAGWTVLRVARAQIKNGQAILWLQEMINRRNKCAATETATRAALATAVPSDTSLPTC